MTPRTAHHTVISMPTHAELELLKSVGARRVLRHCAFRLEGDRREPTEENTHPTAWHLPGHNTRGMVSLLLHLGYMRDQDRFRDHINFTHPDGRYVQIWTYQRILSWYGVPGILGSHP